VARQARTSSDVIRRVSSSTVEMTASIAALGSVALASSVTASRSAL
jgi:hypothetical protein